MSFKLTERQKEARKVLASAATHIMLFGGSRSGKTFLACEALATRALKAPGSRHAIMRLRFNAVKQSVVMDTWPKMMALAHPGIEYTLNKTDWYATLPNNSEVWFGGLDEKERTEKILGMEFATIYLNECSQIPYSARNIAFTRLAQKVLQKIDGVPDKELPLKMYYDCNPPTKSHWTYRQFVKLLNIDTRKPLANPEDYAHFQLNPKHNIENLAATYLKGLESLSARDRRRFLEGEFGDDTEATLFDEGQIDKNRVINDKDLPQMVRIVVAVDPSGTSDNQENLENDPIGIVVVGLGTDGKGYIMADLSVKAGPATWGRVTTDAYERYEANSVVAEQNFGGGMVEHVIKTARPRTPTKLVHASRGKHVRAEPFSALYEQDRVRHVGFMPELEEELVQFTQNGYLGERSPNRADAAIWGLAEIFGGIVQPKQTQQQYVTPWQPADHDMGMMG